MTQEKIDPMYEYVDKQVKLLKREIKQLKVAHDSVAKQHEQGLLDTNRHLAAFIITTTTHTISAIARRHKPLPPSAYFSQLIATAGSAKTSAKTSETPLTIATQFYKKCYDDLEKLGVKIINLS